MSIQFKNAVSVQSVKAFLPYDTTPVPFDFRMNIDYKHILI